MCIRQEVVNSPQHMEDNVFHTAVKKLQPSRVVFAGAGEPLLHPGLPDWIRFLKARSVQTMLSSNLLIDTERIRAITEAGLDILKVSIDAPDEERYNLIRENGNFTRLMENLSFFKSLPLPKPALRFEYVLMKENLAGIPDILPLAASFGAEGVYFRELQTFGMPNDRRRALLDGFDFSALRIHLEYAVQKARSIKIKTNARVLLSNFSGLQKLYNRTLTARDVTGCLLPWLALFVSVQGDTSPCCAMTTNGQVRTGNVMEQSRDELLNGQAMICIRRGFRNGKTSPVCLDCLPRSAKRLLSMLHMLPRRPGFFS